MAIDSNDYPDAPPVMIALTKKLEKINNLTHVVTSTLKHGVGPPVNLENENENIKQESGALGAKIHKTLDNLEQLKLYKLLTGQIVINGDQVGQLITIPANGSKDP